MTETMTTPTTEATPAVVQVVKRKGGRPRGDRQTPFALRLTKTERDRLEAEAEKAGKTLTALVRAAVQNVKVTTRISNTDEQMLGQIKIIGTNLNQSVMALNALAKAKLIDATTLNRFTVQVENVETLLRDFEARTKSVKTE